VDAGGLSLSHRWWLLSPSQLLPLIPLLSLLSLLSLMSMRFVRCLLGKLDAAGHTDALEFPLLLTSSVISADVELDQRPVVGQAWG
jgi:hypothetical protein